MNDIKELNRIRREFLKYAFTVMQNVPHGTSPNSTLLTQVVKERFNTEHSTVIVNLHHAGIRGELGGCIILQDKKRVVLDYDLFKTGYPSYDTIHGRSDLERCTQMNCIVYIEFRNGSMYSIRTLTPDAFQNNWNPEQDGWKCIEYSFAPPCLRYDHVRDPQIEIKQRGIERGWGTHDAMEYFAELLAGRQRPNVLRCIKYKNEHPGDIDITAGLHRDLFPAYIILKYNWDIMNHKDFATLQHLRELPERKVIKAPGHYIINGVAVEHTAQDYDHMPRKLKEFEYMMGNYYNADDEF